MRKRILSAAVGVAGGVLALAAAGGITPAHAANLSPDGLGPCVIALPTVPVTYVGCIPPSAPAWQFVPNVPGQPGDPNIYAQPVPSYSVGPAPFLGHP